MRTYLCKLLPQTIILRISICDMRYDGLVRVSKFCINCRESEVVKSTFFSCLWKIRRKSELRIFLHSYFIQMTPRAVPRLFYQLFVSTKIHFRTYFYRFMDKYTSIYLYFCYCSIDIRYWKNTFPRSNTVITANVALENGNITIYVELSWTQHSWHS